jgi:hypothetical protein
MKTSSHFVGGFVRTVNKLSLPSETETISDDLHLEEILKVVVEITIYYRNKESCPYHRGNWVIDLFSEQDKRIPIFCIKLPTTMKEGEVNRYVKPLIDAIKKRGL